MNVHSLPTATKPDPRTLTTALDATRLALLRMQLIAFSAPNTNELVTMQRVQDMAWRLGYLARGLEGVNDLLNTMVPPTPAAVTVKKEPTDA